MQTQYDTENGAPSGASPDVLAEAIVRTVAYVDIFDYPLTVAEIHRYLKGVPASPQQVEQLLGNGCLVPSRLSQHDGYFMLPGREQIVAIRQQRAALAAQMWPLALRYGQKIVALPFVRMVAVTGSLAVDNAESCADIDYFIVTQPGRLWLCRAFTILIVRMAEREGVTLCPNYFRVVTQLSFAEQSLYAAQELAQMVPLSGLDVYCQMRQANPWVSEYLPNAQGVPRTMPIPKLSRRRCSWRRALETLLNTPAGSWLERWEMNRKIARFARQYDLSAEHTEAAFTADWCKGHFDNHGMKTLQAYSGRLETLHPTSAGRDTVENRP